MRIFYVFLMLIIGVSPVIGQVGLDTLGLTGTMADTVVAKRLWDQGRGLAKNRKFDEAYSLVDSASGIWSSMFGSKNLEVAYFNFEKGKIRDAQSKYQEAISWFDKTLEILEEKTEKNDSLISLIYYNKCRTYFGNRDLERSLKYGNKSLDLRISIFGQEHSDVAAAYNYLGNIYTRLDSFEKSIDCFRKAIHIRIKLFGEKNIELARSYNGLGSTFDEIGELDSAYFYIQKGLTIRLELLGPNHIDVAFSWHDLAVANRKVGLIDESIRCRKKSLEIFIKKYGMVNPNVATEYNGLGVVYQDKGLLEKAFEFYNKGLEIKLKTLGENNPDVAYSYDNFALYYAAKKDYNKAIEYQKKALDIRLASFGAKNREVATSYFNISNFYNDLALYDKAIEYQKISIEILKSDSVKNSYGLAIFYSGLSESLSAKKKYDEAIIEQGKSLIALRKIFGDENPTVAKAYRKLAKCYFRSGDLETADSLYKLSLQSLRYFEGVELSRVNSLKELKYTLKGKALFENVRFSQTSNPIFLENAQRDWKSALDLISKENTDQFESEIESNLEVFQGSIDTYLRQQREGKILITDELLNLFEVSKSLLLRSAIQESNASAFSGIDTSLLQLESRLRINITWREKQRQALLDKGLSETDTNTLRISGIIFDLKRDYEALKQRFETEYPEYYRLKYDLSTVSLQYVQDTLLEPKNQALLEYFVGDSSLFLFVVRPDTFVVQEVKRDFPLEDWIEGLRQGIYGYYTADKAIQTDSLKADAKGKYLEFAPKLYQKLIAPVANLLPEKVILVPDGPLGYVPFDALLTGAPEDANNFKSYPYLIQKHQFSYTYSATLLREMRDKKHRHEPQKDFVAFAPFYNGDTTLLANMYAYDDLMRKDLQPLAFSGPEVAAASKLMHGETVAGAAATEERFTSTAGDYRIIHLATHGRADNRVGDYAFLAFTEIKDSIENELLYVKDLYNLQLNADLVVLSACETGIGKLQRGEGIISLARAFAYAGAKSIVTSLWSVNDKSTSELMRFFYRELQRGKDKDEALRLARLRFLKESSVRNGHPFFWAAFVPLGDMRPVR